MKLLSPKQASDSLRGHHAYAKAAVATLIATATAAAQAAPVDVGAVVTAINDAVAPITLIGGAILVVAVTAKVFKWVKGAM